MHPQTIILRSCKLCKMQVQVARVVVTKQIMCIIASELNSGEMETSTQNFMPHQCNDGAADSLPNSIWCVKPCPKSSPNGSSLCERFANPGIVLCHTEGNTSFKTFELDLLETKLEVKVGENQVKNLAFSADRLQAYVEFEDEAG